MMKIKNIIYRIIDTITFHKGLTCIVNGFKVKFPAKWYRYFESDYEKDNILFIKENCKHDMIAIDVGAHLGLMSIILSQLVGKKGKVISFEPTPQTYSVLKQVIKMNSAEESVFPVNKAVSKENTTIDFFLSSDEGSNSNSLVPKNHRDRKPIKISVTSIDLFVVENKISKVDFMKIDAEGSEYDVLLGAEKTIKNYRPIIILALHPPLIKNNNHDISNIYDFLINNHYKITFENYILSKEEFCTKEDFFDVHLTQI